MFLLLTQITRLSKALVEEGHSKDFNMMLIRTNKKKIKAVIYFFDSSSLFFTKTNHGSTYKEKEKALQAD